MKKHNDRSEHYIFIKRYKDGGEVYYSKVECYNADFYSRIMEVEFNMLNLENRLIRR